MRSVVVAVGLCLLAAPAAAQSDEQKADARAAAEQGATAFQAGNFAEAADLFTRAESLFHAPPHLVFLARAQVKLGQLVLARENYRKVAREVLAQNAPPAFVSAQAEAKQELAALEPRIPMLKVVVKGADPKQVKVTIDGAEVPSQMIGIARPVDPGAREVAATAPGFAAEPRKVTLAEGAKETVELELVADGSAPAPGDGGAAAAGSGEVTADPGAGGGDGLRIASYAAFGVGVVGLGLGTLFALQSSGKRKDADALCEGGCPVEKKAEVNDLYDQAGSKQTLATVGFIAGGVGVAAGVTLFLLSGKKSKPSAARVTPWVGYQAAGVTGTF
jgi:hypothetical protein